MSVLAIDLGASSGRVMRADFQNGRISLTEIRRFDNTPVMLDGCLRWDTPKLFGEIKEGIKTAAAQSEIESIAVDTWGVDFALIGPDGGILEQPVHYRDPRTRGARALVPLPPEALFRRTGLQSNEIHTLFQLLALQKSRPSLLRSGVSLLPMPDFFSWLLTGKITAGRSIASTTQLLNPVTKDWDFRLLRDLKLPVEIFPPITEAGTMLGPVVPELQAELGVPAIPVISVLGHDTSSAALAVPAGEAPFVYVSCGTWSIVGTARDLPALDGEAFAFGLANEIGCGGKAELRRNIVGLWLVQEIRRNLNTRDGKAYSYSDLEQMAEAAPPFAFLIDPDDSAFLAPADMPEAIRTYCQNTGQGVPETDAQLLRCAYDSLALKCRWAVQGLEAVTNAHFPQAHVVGGGSQSALLCRMTAAVLDRPVVAGPTEATALGNAAMQFMALGKIPDDAAARQMIRDSFPVKTYLPEEGLADAAVYQRFGALC